ncbi:cytochrome P450 [Thozetella sp. PMI_491]|nr:cytochrome P450 [Thozetella sp. PMI_491]
MDVRLLAAVSVLETVALVPLESIPKAPGLKTLAGLLLVQYVAVQLYHIFIRPFYTSPLRHLPTPKNNTFFVGQLVNQIRAPSPNTEAVSWMKQWPDAPFVRYLTFANKEVLLVNSLSAHKQVLQTQCYSFEKPSFFKRLLIEISGQGLLFAEGEEHKVQRRQLIGPFSPARIRKLYPVFREKTASLIAHLGQAIDANASDDEHGTFDPDSTFKKATLDVIGLAILGVDFGEPSTNGSTLNFFDHYHAIFNQSPLGNLLTFLNSFVPLRWLPIEANRKYCQAATEIRQILGAVVGTRLNGINKASEDDGGDKEGSQDMLSFMIETIRSGEARWTKAEIVDHVFQFVTAGHETTATTLVLITAALAARPKWQRQLRAEVLEVLSMKQELDAQAVEGMPYLHNFIREVLRVYSPAIMVPREAAKDVMVDGVHIPKGTALMIVPQVIHDHPLVWGKDASEFRPERWDGLSGDAATPYALETFINGPRMCPGKGFASLQIKTVIVELLRNFVLLPIDPVTEFENPAITLKPKGGLRIGVKRLQGSSRADDATLVGRH